MEYDKLFDTIAKGLVEFIKKANIENEIIAEQYRKKFTYLLINGNVLKSNKGFKSVFNSLFDVMYINNPSDSLETSKYVKLALNFIISEINKHTGLSYKDFLKLTLEETDILLEIVYLKQSITEKTMEELNKDLKKDTHKTEDYGNPFIFGGN